jgi:hypothetical protein
VPPKGLGRVGWRESIFASPTAEKQDAHGGKGLVIKRSEVDLLRTKSWVTLKDPVWLRPLRQHVSDKFERDARPAIHGHTAHNLRIGNNYVRCALKFLELLVELQAHRHHLNYQG